MRIQNWSKNIILVYLSPEPKMFDELDVVTITIRKKHDCDVVLDLSGIEIMTAPGSARLLTLHNLLTQHKRRLILCNVSREIKHIFISNELDRLQLTNDKISVALKALQVAS